MKRLLSIVLAALMLFITAGIAASAEDSVDSASGLRYRLLTSGNVEITGYTGSSATLNIPATIAGKQVESIGSYALTGQKFTTVKLGTNIQRVCERAFYQCTALRSFIVATGLEEIQKEAFSGCYNLSSISLNNELLTIGERAFYGCESLDILTFPQNLAVIGDEAFSSCLTLSKVTMNPALKSIGTRAFSECGMLSEVNFSQNLQSVGIQAFAGCYALDNIVIPSGLSTISDGMFYDCDSLKSINLGGVVSIGSLAFASCGALSEITIPDSVTKIGTSAFYSCRRLQTVNMGSGISQIGGAAFIDTPWYDNQQEEFVIIGDGILSKYNGNATEIVIPENVKTIAGTLDSNGKIHTITIGRGVTSIGDYAFGYKYTAGTTPIFQKVDGVTIKGYSGTVAKEYAAANGITFTDLESGAVILPTSSTTTTTTTTVTTTTTTTTAPTTTTTTTATTPSSATGTTTQPTTSTTAVLPTASASNSSTSTTASTTTTSTSKKPTAPKKVYGDADGNGKVNSQDVLLIQKYNAAWAVKVVFELSDVNLDGKVNSQDILQIKRYNAHWDVVLGK